MKKILFLVLIICLLPGLAFAVDLDNQYGVVDFGGAVYSLSNGVYLDYAIATGDQDYGVNVQHKAGNYVFGCTSGSAGTWRKDIAEGTEENPPSPDAAYTTGGFLSSGWTQM